MNKVTKEDLKQYRAMKKEMEQIKNRLIVLNSYIKNEFDRKLLYDSVRKSPSQNCLKELIVLKKVYQERFEKLLKKEKDIQAFIASVEDSELAAYIMLKYINSKNKSDEEIGKVFYYDRTTLPKKLNQLLKKQN